jgi:hypothetical protein
MVAGGARAEIVLYIPSCLNERNTKGASPSCIEIREGLMEIF